LSASVRVRDWPGQADRAAVHVQRRQWYQPCEWCWTTAKRVATARATTRAAAAARPPGEFESFRDAH